VTIRSIISLQRALHETGRIRLGEQVPIESGPNKGKMRASKLTKFRFTSAHRRSLEAVARLYGGEVKQWTDTAPVEGQWELYADVSEIDVVVFVSDMAFSQCYELWSASGCKRRCDSAYNELDEDGRCLCNPDKRDCKLTTRVSFMLAQIPGIGLWRLETHSYYSGLALLASFEMAHLLAQSVGRSVLPGKLRLMPDAKKRPTPTKSDPDKVSTFKFMKVFLDFDVDMSALALGASPIAAPSLAAGEGGQYPPPALPAAGLTPVPSTGTPSIPDQIAAAAAPKERPRRSNSPPSIPSTGRHPRTAQAAAGENAASHGAEGDPRTVPSSTAATAAPFSPQDRAALARARVDMRNRITDALDRSEAKAFEETIDREWPPDERTLGEYEAINEWLDENLPNASFRTDDETAGRAPGKSGASDGEARRDGDEDASPPPPAGDVPGYAGDLHRKAQELGLAEEAFDAVVYKVTAGRTTSAKELKAREASRVFQHLLEIEAGNLVVIDGSDGWVVQPK
jgi:hypothetical protein